MKITSSIKFKLALVTAIICPILAVSVNLCAIQNSKMNYREVIRNYLYDVTISSGQLVETLVKEKGEAALEPDELAETLKGVGITNVSSSYAYVVNSDGTMLYHPTAEKIGQPVENAVVTGLVEDLKNGTIHDPEVVTYEFKGAQKYAAYFINGAGTFILVISADEKEVMAPFSRIIAISSGVSMFISVVAIVVVFLLITKLMAPLGYANRLVNALASLDFRVTDQNMETKYAGRKDEIGHLVKDMVELRGKLLEVVDGLQQQSKVLFSASDSLNVAAKNSANSVDGIEQAVLEIADGASSQAGDTQKVTEDILEIGNMVEKTNKNVVELKKNADDIERLGYSAKNTLTELESVNEKTGKCIEEIYEQTNNTNASVMKISNAVQLITSIAEETNLLSLNASIEAARAGEQGKGFAVVAAQIQKLAEQSNNSAQEIETIIQNLMEDSEKAVSTMDDVKKIMSEQSEKMEMTDRIFEDVLKGIIKSKNGIEAIAENTRQMDMSKEGIVNVVESLSSIAEQNAASTQVTTTSVTEVGLSIQEMSGEADHMKEIAAELEKSIGMFQI